MFCVECRCAAAQAEVALPTETAVLASRVSPTLGNLPVLWATKIRLEMRLGLTLCAFTESCNPELLLLRHLLNFCVFKRRGFTMLAKLILNS